MSALPLGNVRLTALGNAANPLTNPKCSAAAGLTCVPIRVDVPALDEDPTAASAAVTAGAAKSSSAAGAPSSWHQLWGAGPYQDVLPNAAAGSFLLGEGVAAELAAFGLSGCCKLLPALMGTSRATLLQCVRV